MPDPSSAASTRAQRVAEERAMGFVELLAGDVGSRRPTSRDERVAAELIRRAIAPELPGARLEPFRGYDTFSRPFASSMAAAIAPGLLPARMRVSRSALALAASVALALEGDLRRPLLSRAISRRPSQNLVATVEPRGRAERTLCLMAHIDTSRSGAMFHPRLVGALGAVIGTLSVAGLAQGPLEALVGSTRSGRAALGGLRATLLAGLLMLAERELRGVDVPGANDNASGCGVCAALALEIAAAPLSGTRVVLVLTGCEEAGTLGSQAFLEGRDTADWLFLNVDNVGGPGSVRYLRREGVIARWNADPGLVGIADEVAGRRPELRMAPEDNPAGLTYDSSPILARGGRALTLSVQDGSIPNLHRPTDTVENVDPDGVARTIVAAREMIAAVDAGLAD